jgi:hypothetical protein
MQRNSDFALLRDILQNCLRNLGWEPKLKEAALLALWPEVAGPHVARFTQAESFKGGTLFVNVANHVWLQHLSFFKELLMQKLNERLGEPLVEKVFFRNGAVNARREPEEKEGELPSRKWPSLSSVETQEIEELVMPLKDEELKNLLKIFLTKARLHEQLQSGENVL